MIRFDFVITRRKVKDSVFPIFPIFAGFRLRSAACALLLLCAALPFQAAGTATGFAFDTETPDGLLAAIQRAVALYSDRASWRRMMRQAMIRDFSWAAAAREYVALYQGTLARTAGEGGRGRQPAEG